MYKYVFTYVYIGLTRAVADDDGDVLPQHLRLGANTYEF